MRRVGLILGIFILIGIAAGFWLWRGRGQTAPQDTLVLYGNVDIRQVQMAFNANERIAQLLVQEGDRIRAGQLLATLEPQRLEARVASRDAIVAAQREIVARLEAGSRPEEIRKAKADMDVAGAEASNAQLTYQRVTNLIAQAVVPPQQLDDARAALNTTAARLKAAEETYHLAVIGPRKEDIEAAKATLQAYEADLMLTRRELADSKLFAPTNGVIQDRILEVGDMASPQKPVFTIALDDPVWVRAYVPETALGKIRLGMQASISTDSFPSKRYEGWIGFISPTAEFTPKTVETAEVRSKLVYQVRVFASNPQGELRLGMPAVITVPLTSQGGRGEAAEQPANNR